jgi:hypothetical protein
MTIAADDGCARESEALLWSDDVDNALSLVAESKVCQAKLFDVGLEGLALRPAVGLVNEGGDILEVLA